MLEEGKILQGRYLIVRKIGEGGMGAVYMAKDQRLDNTVALKETLVNDESLLRAFEREARLLAGLRHPALPKVSDHFTEGGSQYLVMDFITGDDLAAVLDKRRERIAPLGQPKPFTQDEALNWGDQLLDALDYLHAHEPPVVHRDIKPQNLKITERNQVILLDFGLAKGSASQTTAMTIGKSIFGFTPTYAPLEQMEGSGTDPRSDLYSLGATLYHLVTGQTPPDALKRITMTMSNQPDPLLPANQVNPQVSRAVASVLAWAMSLRSDERPASARAFRRALKDARQAPSTSSGAERAVKTAPPVANRATQTPPQNSMPQRPAPTTNPQPPPQQSWPPTQQSSPPPQQSWPPQAPQPSWPPQPAQPSWPPQQSWPPAQSAPSPQNSWPQPPAPARWSQPPTISQTPYPQRKSNKTLWIVIGVLAFVVIIVALLLAVDADMSSHPNSSASSTPSSSSSSSPGKSPSPPPVKPSDNATSSTPATTMEPRIVETLDRYTAALGGKETVEGVTTRVAKGSLEMPDVGAVGTVEIYAKAPNKLVLIMNVPGLGVVRTGFNGSVGWAQEPNLGLRRVEGAELAAMKRDADFYHEIRLKELYSTMSFEGKESVDGRETNVIKAIPPEGGSEKWYFDAQNGLLMRSDVERASVQGLTTNESHFEQYRKVDGINYPTVLRQSNGMIKSIIRLKEITHNVSINDALFNMPSN